MSWYDAPSNGTLIATGTSYTSTFSATTTYYVIANNGTRPSNPVPVTATINTLPVVSLGPDTVNILSGQTVTLDAGAGFSSYLWSTTATTQTINTGVSGTYSVTVTDGNGCTGSDSIVVNIITGLNAISGDISSTSSPIRRTGVSSDGGGCIGILRVAHHRPTWSCDLLRTGPADEHLSQEHRPVRKSAGCLLPSAQHFEGTCYPCFDHRIK